MVGRAFNYSRARKAPSVTLVEFLAFKFTYHSKDEWAITIKDKGWVTVDKVKVTDPAFVLPERATIGFDVPAEAEPEVDERMLLLHADDAVAVVVKSGNMPVSEGGRYSKRTLIRIAPRVFAEQLRTSPSSSAEEKKDEALMPLFAVHRLDKETSGIVVMARTLEATQHLGLQFSRSGVEEQQQQQERDGPKSVAVAAAAYAAALVLPPQRRERSQEDNSNTEENHGSEIASPSAASIEKEYFAILLGKLDNQPHDIQLRIGFEHEIVPIEALALLNRKLKKQRMAVVRPASSTPDANSSANHDDDDLPGKSARTVIMPVLYSKNGEMTACRIRLYTGRTHQIRIHCAAIGHPIVGEKLYVAGGGSVDCDTYLERARGNLKVVHKLLSHSSGGKDDGHDDDAASSICSERHLLHAAMLKFVHPTLKTEMCFRSDPWSSFLQACPDLARFFDIPKVSMQGT